MRKVMGGLAAVVFGSLTLACGVGGGSDEPVDLPDVSKQQPTAATTTIGEGTWVVGKHVKAGTYRTRGALESQVPLCSWFVKEGETIKSIGTVNKPKQPGQVALKKGLTFETRGCQEWVLQ